MRALAVDQRWQPVVNWVPYPALESNTTGWTPIRATTSHPDNTYTRLTSTETNAAVAAVRLQSPLIPVRAAAEVTISARFRSTLAALIRIHWLDSGNAIIHTSSSPVVSPSATFTPVSFSATVPAGAVNCEAWLASGEAVTVGDVMDWRHVMLTPGPTSYAYADGDTPGWRWLGAPGASPSVGHPRPA